MLVGESLVSDYVYLPMKYSSAKYFTLQKLTTAAIFVTLRAAYMEMPHDLQGLIPFSLLSFALVVQWRDSS